jgi:hypothetical protein
MVQFSLLFYHLVLITLNCLKSGKAGHRLGANLPCTFIKFNGVQILFLGKILHGDYTKILFDSESWNSYARENAKYRNKNTNTLVIWLSVIKLSHSDLNTY